MRVIEIALYPLVVALNGLGNGILRMLGVERSAVSDEHYRTADELSFIVAESRAGGLLAREPAEDGRIAGDPDYPFGTAPDPDHRVRPRSRSW